MSDEEFGPVFDALSGDDGEEFFDSAFKARESGNALSDLKNAWENFLNSDGAGGVKLFDDSSISFDDDDNIIMTKDGKQINLTEVKQNLDDLGGPYGEDGEPLGGNLDDAFKELGFDTGTTEFKSFKQDTVDAWNNSEKGVVLGGDKAINGIGDELGLKDVEDPGSNEKLNKFMEEKYGSEKTDEVNKGYEEASENAKEAETDPEKKKKATSWLRKALGKAWDIFKAILGIGFMIALLGLGLALYDFIKALQHAMSGCWAVNSKGQTGKILEMTCSRDDRTSQSLLKKWKPCLACTDIKKCPSGVYWIPVQKKAKACDPSSPFPGTYTPTDLKNDNPCTGKKPNEMYACANADKCISMAFACNQDNNQGDCSALCNMDSVMVPPGTTIQCKKVTWGGALGAAVGGILGSLGINLSKIVKTLIIIVACIFGLWIFFYIARWLISKGEGSSDGGGSDSHTLKIQLSHDK